LGAVAFCARPYDALLVLTPFVVWFLARAFTGVGRSRRLLVWAAGAALPVLVAQAAYNAYVTGDALRLPYSLWSSTDRLGFGYRGLLPSGVPQTYFGPRQGLHGVVDNLWSLNLWAFGGAALAILALVGLSASWRKPAAPALAAVAVAVPLGYF